MRSTLRKSLYVLLALFFAVAVGWPGAPSLAGQASAISLPPCHCCNADHSHCATPACCARPADNRVPDAPTVPRRASTQEWLAAAPPPTTFLTLHSSTLKNPSVCPRPVQARAVPIFQRNCSFLL